MEDILVPFIAITSIFIGLPWIIFHYITKWKTASSLTAEDEDLLDGLHDLARRLDDRICTIERILQAENPNWRSIGCEPGQPVLENRVDRMLEDERASEPKKRRTR